MKIPYIKIPITDMYAYLAPYSAQTKGQIFEAVLSFGLYQTWSVLPLAPAEQQAYAIVQQMIEKEIKSYKKFCKEQKQKIKKYWNETKNIDDTPVLPGRKNQPKQETKTETKQETEFKYTSTARPGAAQTHPEERGKKKTLLQQFSNRVLERFESTVQTDAQKGIWFKRNCRCLSDILNFCNQDIELALQTISVCARGLAKAGLWGGYEAVCRNLPEYMARAQKELEEAPYV